jgi:hypothetical protein
MNETIALTMSCAEDGGMVWIGTKRMFLIRSSIHFMVKCGNPINGKREGKVFSWRKEPALTAPKVYIHPVMSMM